MKSAKKPFPSVPTTFVVLGITGDLAARKIIPALDTLAQNSLLPSQFELVGVSRGTFTPKDFKNHLISLLPKKKGGVSTSKLPFIQNATHVAGNLNDKQVYIDLKKTLDAFDQMKARKTETISLRTASYVEAVARIVEARK